MQQDKKIQDAINLLGARFEKNFAIDITSLVIQRDLVAQVLLLATDQITLDRKIHDKVVFRGAYIIETIYFNFPESLPSDFIRSLIRTFPNTQNASAKRHFAKIVSHILKDESQMRAISNDTLSKIAGSAIEWITERDVKTAVSIWCMEILLHIRQRLAELDPMIEDLIEYLMSLQQPSLNCRIRSWKRAMRRDYHSDLCKIPHY